MSNATIDTPARTSMNCIRCGGFSSTRVCWSCSQRHDAIDFALLEDYRKDAERYRWLRDHVSEIVWHEGPGKVGNLRKEYHPGKLDEWVAEGMAIIDRRA